MQFRRTIFVSNLQGTRIFDEVLFSIQTLIYCFYERLNVYICASYCNNGSPRRPLSLQQQNHGLAGKKTQMTPRVTSTWALCSFKS